MTQDPPAPTSPKVGFVGWNPFQFLHFGKIIPRFPGSTLVVEERRSAWKPSDFMLPGLESYPILHLSRADMRTLDGKFDVLVCQTPFAGIEDIRESRIAMLQYGYAKEAHNFAPWRSFADVCLTFGSYASGKIEPFCPCVATGNPRYECWEDPGFHEQARIKYSGRLDPAKKTLLYAPTWGELSSYAEFADAVLGLSESYNVIFKIHHNTQRSGVRSIDPMRRKFGVIHGADEDIVELLSIADVLISDFSGAIFDAIYCEVPVVLLGAATAGDVTDSKSDHYSIEQARRAELGEVVETTAGIAGAVSRAAGSAADHDNALSRLRAELFCESSHASALAARVIRDVANGAYSQSQTQHYIRREMTALHRSQSEFALLRKIRRFLNPGGKRP